MSTTDKPVLIVGATGRHGGTGAMVARILKENGTPIRAMARRLDDRVEHFKASGVQVVQADLHDRLSLVEALKGVETAYFTYPIAAGVVDAAANFASAGRAAGLKRLVVMSMGPAHPQSPSHLGRAQWLAEQIFEWAGFDCLHLRIAAAFLENIEMLHAREIAEDGVIRNAFPDIPVSWIMGEDAARVAAAALLNPDKFSGGPAVYPGTPHQYTQSEIAKVLGEYLGRNIRYQQIPKQAWRDQIVKLSANDNRLNADMAGHISSVADALNHMSPLPPNDMIETVTGRKPMSLMEALVSKKLVVVPQ